MDYYLNVRITFLVVEGEGEVKGVGVGGMELKGKLGLVELIAKGILA